MTTLITGASGFLGGALTHALVRRGEAVRILARPTSRLVHLHGLDIDVALGCVEDADTLRPALRGVHAVYHCAALASDWGPWPAFYGANVVGAQNVLQAAVEAGSVERFLHVSTSDVYGYPEQPCDESHPLVDTGLPYNRSKVLGEQAVWDCARNTGLPITIVRPVTIYGPRSKDFGVEIARLLFHRQMVLIDNGRPAAGLLYIDNAVEGIIEAAESPRAVGQAYNLRDEGDTTWATYIGDLAQGLSAPMPWLRLSASTALTASRLMEALFGALHSRRRPLLTRHAVYTFIRDQSFPIAKARDHLTWQPRVSYSQAMETTLAWLCSAEGERALAES